MVRTWEETQGGKYPPANHHPGCDAFELLPFAAVADGNGVAVIEIRQLSEWFQACVDNEDLPTVEVVYITEDQFNNMPEYEG